MCSTNRNAKPRENALSISITDSENLELEEEAYKACWVALVFFRDTRICRRCNEGNIFLAMHSHDREKKGHNKLNSWFWVDLNLNFHMWSYLIIVIFDFPLIPIFGTSFWSWKHRFGFDGVSSKRTHMRDTIQKVFPCCQPSRDLRSSRLESLKAEIFLESRTNKKREKWGQSLMLHHFLNCWSKSRLGKHSESLMNLISFASLFWSWQTLALNVNLWHWWEEKSQL